MRNRNWLWFLPLVAAVLFIPASQAQTFTQITSYGAAQDDSYGASVSAAGDVNGDGFGDMIVGAPYRNSPSHLTTGGARIVSGSDGTILFTRYGDAPDDGFGWSVSDCGDANNDGYGDFIVGASGDDTNGFNAGMARVFSGVDGSTLFTMYGDLAVQHFGWSVSGAGDVNNDNFDDFIVGTHGGEYARVFSGFDGSILFNFVSGTPGDLFGNCVSNAGDINNDGFADLLVGAYRDANNGTDSGSARVFSGLDGSILFHFDGPSSFDQFGLSVSDAGDVNGDSYPDIIIGAVYGGLFGQGGGLARVFSGLDGTVLHSFTRSGTDVYFGYAVSGAGDVNGDGASDLIVASYDFHSLPLLGNRATVFSGLSGAVLFAYQGGNWGTNPFATEDGPSVSGAGDINNDGFADFIIGNRFDHDPGGLRTGSAVLVLSPIVLPPTPLSYTYDGDAAGDHLGQSVCGIGDINNDGHDDLLVGAPFDDDGGMSAGRAQVFSGLNDSLLFVIDGSSAGDQLGTSVSAAGDINDDGVADFIIGAPGSDTNGTDSGNAQVLSGVDATILFNVDGDSAGDRFGSSVSTAGDVNNDGHDDFIVGAPSAAANGAAAGLARVYSGNDGSVLFTFDGDSAGDHLGHSVGNVGDLNSDGFDDLIVGAHLDDGNGTNSGSAFVFSGADGSILFHFQGNDPGDWFGYSVSGAGDVNRDGIPDLVVGAPRADSNGSDSGTMFVFSGLNGTTLYTIDGEEAGDQLGYSVSRAGDVNGDAYADVIGGAPENDIRGLAAGRILVISGINGELLMSRSGKVRGDRLGHSVSDAGDVNADGASDVFAGAPNAAFNGTGAGGAQLMLGFAPQPLPTAFSLNGELPSDQFGRSVSMIGDVNGDWRDDVVVGIPFDDYGGQDAGRVRVLSGLNGSTLFAINGDSPNDQFGTSVADAGDVNGDGINDLVVGAPGADSNGSNSGRIRVYSGSDTSVLFTCDGDAADDEMGHAVAGAGDVNNDGYDDFIAGAPGDAPNGVTSGSARVFSGFDGSVLYTFDGLSAGDQMGFSVSGAGDINGDGFDELIVGAPAEGDGPGGGGSGLGSATVFSGFDGSVLYTFVPAGTKDYFGFSVAGAGDVNSDGTVDLVVGIPEEDNGGNNSGSVHVYSGIDGNILYIIDGSSSNDSLGWAVDGCGDINADGFADLFVGIPGGSDNGKAQVYSGIDGSLLYTFVGGSTAGRFGVDVSSSGDLNADGFDDLLIGDSEDSANGVDAGSIRVFLAPFLPTLTYSSDTGFSRLRLRWFPDGGDVNSLTGTISVEGATPGGLGVFGVSLAPANILIFGFPLLIANDPINLIDSGILGYGFGGEIVVPGITRQNVFLAGSFVFLQFFESSPIPGGSNGLAIQLAP